MKLFELKDLYQYLITEVLVDKEQHLETIEKNLMAEFKVSHVQELPQKIGEAYNEYKDLFLKLQSLCEKIETAIKTHELTGELDDSDVKWEYFPEQVDSEEAKIAEVVQGYELLRRKYSDLKLSCQQAEKDKSFPGKLIFNNAKKQHVNLVSNDFSDEFVDSISQKLTPILAVMSGEFNCEAVNQQLSKELGLDTIEPETFIHENFGKDGYATYFDNQCVHTPVRDTNTPIQIKKIDDFVNSYLKKSGVSETIKPNLKALLSTLSNQGALGFIPCILFGKFFWVHGAKIMNFGADYRIHIGFDEENQFRIQILVDQNRYLILKGNDLESIKGITSLIKMEFTIAVKVVNNVPNFILKETSVACSFATPENYPITIASKALKNPDSIASNQLEALCSSMECLVKFLGYSSLEQFYIAKGGSLVSVRDKNAFDALDFSLFLDMACSDSNGKKLSESEYHFFRKIADGYNRRNLHTADISIQICKFVDSALANPKLNSEDKLRYIHWLQLARKLKGNENPKDEIHDIYELLVKELVTKDSALLIEAAKDDAELYQEMIDPSSLFTRNTKVSEDYHARTLAKYPLILQGNKSAYFVKLLNNLKSQAKLLFLVEFIKKGGDITCLDSIVKNFFNKSLIGELTTAVQKNNAEVLQLLYSLVTQAPADTLIYLRKPLEKVLEAYNKTLLTQSADHLLEFLLTMRDSKLFERFGIEFLEKLVAVVVNLSFSEDPEEFSKVPVIVRQIDKMLNADSALLESRGRESFFLGLNVATKQVSSRLRGMIVEAPEQDSSSTSEDEEFESLLESGEGKEKADLKEAREKSEPSVEDLDKAKGRSAVSLTIPSQRELTKEEASLVDTVKRLKQ